MAAGSVKLPDLKQEIRVDTKDLQRAEAAAKRFKREMDRTLRGDHNITVDVKGDLTRLREQLKAFKGDVEVEVSGDLTKLRNQLRAFRGETEAQVSGDLTRLREELAAFRGEVDVKADLDVAALEAELEAISRSRELKFDADTSEATAKILELKALAEAVSDKQYELKFVIRENDVQVLNKLREATVAEREELSRFEGQATQARESLQGLTRGFEQTAKAQQQLGRLSAEARRELQEAQQAVKAAEQALKASRTEASQAAKAAATSEKDLAKARQDAGRATKAVEAADRALVDAHGAAEVAAAKLQAAEAKTGAVFAQSLPAIAEVEKAERELGQARAEQERVDGIVADAERQLNAVRGDSSATAKQVQQAERYLQFTRESQPAALAKVEAATERLSAAQAKQAAAEAKVVAAAAASRKAEEDHERALARVAQATQALTAAREGAEAPAGRIVELERNVANAHQEAENAATRTRDAERDLARASQELSASRERLGEAMRRGAQEATQLANSHRNLHTTLRTTASAAGLATKAIGGLGVAGIVAGGIGTLGAGVIGLGSALAGASPAVLGLTGAIGGLGVSVLGLSAIFKSNEGLKGSSEILKQAFQGIQDDLQRRVNPSIIEFMRSVAGLAPIAREMVPPFATAFNEIATMFSNLLKDTSFQNDLRLIVSSGIRQFRSFGEAGRNAIQGIISLAAATGPYVERIAQGFVQLTADFRDWVNEARRTGELNRLLERSTAILEGLGRTVRDLAVGFKNMFLAADLSGFTQAVLGTLEGIAQDFRRFTVERQADLQRMFANLKGQFEGLRPLVASLANGIREILTNIDLTPLMRGIQAIIPQLAAAVTEAANAVARIAESAAPAINSILALIRGLIPQVESIIKTVVTNVTQVVDAVRPGIERFATMLASIGRNVIPVIAGAARNLGTAFSTAMIVIKPIGEVLGAIVGLLGDMSGAAGIALSAFLGYRVLQGIFGGAAQGATRLSQGIKNLATGTTTAGNKVGILGGAVRGLVQPFAAAALGAGRLAKGAVEMARGNETAAQSTSGLIRGLSQVVQSYQRGAEGASQFGDRVRTTAVTALRPLENLGRGLTQVGEHMTRLAGNTTTVSQRITAGLGAAFTQAGNTLNAFGQTASTVGATLAGRLGAAVQTSVGALGRFGGVLSGVATAGMTALQRGAQGLVGALGGLSGIAIAGVITALATMGAKSQEAAQNQQTLRAALDQSGGAIDANVTKVVQAKLEQSNLAAASQALGVSMTELASSVATGGQEYDAYIQQLEQGLGYFPEWLSFITDISAATGDETAQRRQALYAMKEERGAMQDAQAARQAYLQSVTQTNQAMTASQRAAQEVSTGFDKMKQSAGDASKFVDGLTQALDGISGRSKSADEANKQFGESLRQMAQAAQQGGEGIKILNGDLDEQSASGARAYDAVTQLREATLQKAAADFQAAGGTSNLQAAQAAANQTITQGKQAMVDSLTQMGANRAEAQRYADQLFAIPPEVLTKILADPANAQRIVEDWRKGVTTAPPVPAPVGANTNPAQADVDKKKQEIQNAPPAQAPVGGNTQPLDLELENKKRAIVGLPPIKAPIGGETKPLDKDVTAAQGNIEGAAPAALPVGGNLIVEQQVQAFVARLNAYQAAILPINANVQPGESQALAWVGRINAFPGAMLPINANVAAGEQQALAWVARINGFQGAALPISANIDQLNQQYNQAYTFITRTVIVAPITGNIDQLNQLYNQAYTFISSTVIIAPVSGDFSQLINMYQQIVNQIQSTPIIIPIYGQFMGIQGLPGGMAAGGIIANEKGRIAEFFANGGMSDKDRATLNAVAGPSNQYPDKRALDGMGTAKSMGLTPMSANYASIVAPNTWRVIGDRAQDDESYIPINSSQRSQQILAETAKRMGYALEKFAEGGTFSHASPTNNATYGNPNPDTNRAVASSVTTTNEAPLVAGDLVVTVPQDTPVNDAMNEVLFTLKRARRGGVHRSGGG